MDAWTDGVDQFYDYGDYGEANMHLSAEQAAYTHRQVGDITSENYYEDEIAASSPSPSGWPSHDDSRFTARPTFADNVENNIEDFENDIFPEPTNQYASSRGNEFNYRPLQQTIHRLRQISSTPRPNMFQYSYSGLPSTFVLKSSPFTPTVEPQGMVHRSQPPTSAGVSRPEGSYDEDDQFNVRGSKPLNVHGVQLRQVTSLPDVYRGVFKFPVFNTIQSKCFDTIMKSDENLVISAPTGSGKTVLFELSIIHMVMNGGSGSKCVYMAPTKALCSERYRDWVSRFGSLGIKCCELTGDTVHFGKGAWGDARHATIIITTGEKWDSLTRSWRDHGHVLSQIQLFLVDEVHILNESRGSTLEVIMSRMKSRGSAVRFITVSATVPNINDVANWIGNEAGSGPAKVFEFDETYRPCKLTRFVYGFPRSKNQNDFTFASSLSYRLFSLLQQHSANKPILVFAPTRNGVLSTAERLMADYTKAAEGKQTLPWSPPRRIEQTFTDKRLEKLAQVGIGAHHAGLNVGDKRIIEDLFLNKVIRVVVATSTLAIGVNLPAHIVVIKGVKVFQGGSGAQEYSDLDIMQMMGRAGRPQFDKEGIAIIMCESELEQKYKALTHGKTILESSLHRNLSEHLNSELGLGTISNMETAKKWIHSSFFYQRLRQNPGHYAAAEGEETWEEKLDGMLSRSVEGLKEARLIQDGAKNGELTTTEYGDIMSRFYIRQSTMALIMKLPDRITIRDLVETIAAAEEISDLKLRAGEKQVYNKLRDHSDIRFKIKKVEKTTDKLFLLIQASLGGISLHSSEYKTADSQPHAEVGALYKHLPRIARAIVEVAMVKENGSQIKHALELLRVFNARTWEDRPAVLGQLSSVGEKSIKVLSGHGITTFDSLRKIDQFRLEQILSRKTGTGATIIAALAELPKYLLEVKEISLSSYNGKDPVDVELAVKCGLERVKSSSKSKKKERSWDYSFILSLTSDHDLIDFRRIPTNALRDGKEFIVETQLTKPSQSIIVYISSEIVAGVTVSATYKPKIDCKEFPTLDTRPKSSAERDLEGLEDDPDFWNWNMSQDESKEIPIKDLTKSRSSTQEGHLAMPPAKPRGGETSSQLRLPPAPEKLPNGKFVCNHTCKDKTLCRHLCCREGLDKPPTAHKRRDGQLGAEAKGAAAETPTRQRKPKNAPKKAQNSTSTPTKPQAHKSANRYMDSQMRQLDSLHARTGVASNLQMTRGQRIKVPDNLESSRSSDARKYRSKPTPKFDLELSNLEDDRPTNSDVDIGDLSDEDDLPSARELLQSGAQKPQSTKKAPSTGSSVYDNSEIDSLIRAAPMEEFIDLSGSPEGSVRAVEYPENMNVDNTWNLPRTPPPARKRGRDKGDDGQDRSGKPSKRAKGPTQTSRLPSPELPEPITSSPEPQAQKLFFSDSSRDNEPQLAPLAITRARSPFVPPGDEDFVLDESLFDFGDADKTLVPDDPVKQVVSEADPPPPSIAQPHFFPKARKEPRFVPQITPSSLEQSFYERMRKAEEEEAKARQQAGGIGSTPAIGFARNFYSARPARLPPLVSDRLHTPDLLSTATSTASVPSPVPVTSSASTHVSQAPAPPVEEEPDIIAELEEWLATTTDIVWK